MPITLHIDHAKQRITGIGVGVVTVADMRGYVAERVRLGVYSYTQLIDMRDATVDIPPGENLFGVAMDARHESRAGAIPRTAIVAREGTATFGYARQLAVQLGFGKANIEVFSDLQEGESWLAADHERV